MKRTLLFVCIGNACRSIMAEALLKHYWAGRYEAASAGLSPLGRVTENTLAVLREAGAPIDGLHSKGIGGLDLDRFELIVNLSEYPLHDFIPSRCSARVVNWYVRDPYGESLDSYRTARDAIEWLITEKVPEWLEERAVSS